MNGIYNIKNWKRGVKIRCILKKKDLELKQLNVLFGKGSCQKIQIKHVFILIREHVQ